MLLGRVSPRWIMVRRACSRGWKNSCPLALNSVSLHLRSMHTHSYGVIFFEQDVGLLYVRIESPWPSELLLPCDLLSR